MPRFVGPLPAPIHVINLITGQPVMKIEKEGAAPVLDDPWDMNRILAIAVFIDEKIPSGLKGSRVVKRLTNAFKRAKEGDVVEVDASDWEIVKKIFEEPVPQKGYNPWPQQIMGQLTAFMEIWVDAEETPPGAPVQE